MTEASDISILVENIGDETEGRGSVRDRICWDGRLWWKVWMETSRVDPKQTSVIMSVG